MKRLGISIYPENASFDAIKSYIELAASYGFSRIFTCLISLTAEDFENYKALIKVANAHKMEVIADIDPSVLEAYKIEYTDLRFFKEIGLSGIRLDLGFSGYEESLMSQNPYGLSIELNMSNGTKYIDNILSYQGNKDQLIGCHNFYPHRYTGLERAHFIKCSKQFKEEGLRTAAFVSSHSAEYGPWPVSEGLSTLEEHRNLDIVTQAKDLFNTGLIDDVIIGNMFASEEDLKALSRLNKSTLALKVTIEEEATALHKTIILNEAHFNRGDISAYMIRSTQSREKYKGEAFPAINTRDIKKGDIIIESSLYTRYAGELQIALRDMKNSGKSSIVGQVKEEELYLLDQIAPWQHFTFEESGE